MTDETKRPGTSDGEKEQAGHERIAVRPSRHLRPRPVRNVVFHIRQVLNVLFMLTGIAGVMMYCGLMGEGLVERQGIIVIVIAVSIKMAECMLRFWK